MLKLAVGLLGVALMIGIGLAQSTRPAAQTQPADQRIERGRYLVHDVAMCVECHTPRDAQGNLMMGRLLRGARMPVSSPWSEQEWCFETPHIAGLPGWTDEGAVEFLMTGLDYRGYRARAPMPQFRLKREDAQAVVAYLRSLR